MYMAADHFSALPIPLLPVPYTYPALNENHHVRSSSLLHRTGASLGVNSSTTFSSHHPQLTRAEQVINRLMQDSSIPEHGRNIFSLVRTPDQTTLDNFNSNPPINPFSTGFLNTPDTELRRYTRQRISDLERERSISLSSKWVAVLDERSVTDNTVVIHRYETKSEWEQLQREAEGEWVGIPGMAENNEDDDSIWWKWRVPFDAVFHLYNHVETFSWRGVAWRCGRDRSIWGRMGLLW